MIKFIIWISVALIICSLLLEINKEYILETISYPLVQARFILGFVLGFSLFYIVSEGQKSREKRSDPKFKLFITIFLIIAVCQTLNTFFLKGYFNYIPKINIQFFISSGFGLIGGIIFQRGWVWISQKFTSKSSVKSVLERESKSDIRDLDEFSTQIKQDYDPKKYFRENEFFLALNEKDKPIYWPEKTLPHIQVCGMTGSGKGVFLGSITAQCATKGESVFIIDPKDDEWFPHVAHSASKYAQTSYDFIDLRKPTYQFNLFEDASSDEIEELLLAGFELGDKGEAADFYKLADREMAHFVAKNLVKGQTAEAFYLEHHEFLNKQAIGFSGKFRELADIKAVNAVNGLSLKDVITSGGIVYIVGSMRNAKIVRIQK